MNKTDKILYSGFAVVAIGGIVAMLVSVFSPPKQIAEETTETPKTELQTLETAAPAVAPLPLETVEDENKPILTEEQFWNAVAQQKEQEWLEAERKEKEWLASRQDWIDRFPFQQTHHPEITFDPEAHDPNEARPTNEKDDAYWEMLELVTDHGFLRNFYQSRLPYTEEFERMHDIIHEELGEMANDTILQGMVFDRLKNTITQ